jgi:hypothetical protein
MGAYMAKIRAGLFTLIVVIGIMAYGASVLTRTQDTADLETRKIRLAAATFTGIFLLFIFRSILYYVNPDGAGKDIFDKAFTAMFTIVGTVVGYIFGIRKDQGTTAPAAPATAAPATAAPATAAPAQDRCSFLIRHQRFNWSGGNHVDPSHAIRVGRFDRDCLLIGIMRLHRPAGAP